MEHRAKKSLGQNFLKSKRALSQIIAAAELSPADTVLEIGPGKGTLTELLLENAGRIIAVEKDRELIAYLREKFAEAISAGKLILIEDDILNFEFERYALRVARCAVVANIPYNITGAILRKFLSAKNQPEEMILLVQKEVAERIVARDKKESILSISVKAYGAPKYVAKVPARDFSPAPKVDSAIISIKNISRANFKDTDEKFFFELVRSGFAHKRKILIKNLEAVVVPEKLRRSWSTLGLSPKIRAEDMALSGWLSLSKILATA